MRILLATTAVLTALTAPAIAEAPGECDTCVLPPGAAVVASRPSDLARRIGVGARAVSMTLGGESSDARTEYSGAGIAASYRLGRRWELALSIDSLDAEVGPALHATLLAARFHLTPHRAWDWYAMVGIGAIHEGHDGDDGASRGQLHLGAGLQRRWHRVGLAAELDLVGVGSREATADMAARSVEPVMTSDDGLSGGQFSLAAMFYF